MQKNTVEYTLADYQDDFINSEKRIVSIIGAKGSSKTWSGARFALVQATKQRRAQGLIMANSRQQILDIFEQDIRPLLEDLHWPYSFNAQSLNVKLFDSVIHLRSADPDAVKKIESIAYHWGWADEASYYDPETLKTFTSRIRKGKKLVRITSMPDEPDHTMYEFIERLTNDFGGELYEIGLLDNPDKEFVENYTKILKATYSGPQLERFLYGKRVSLEGQGLFGVQPEMRGEYPYDPEDPLLLSWDFNVEYRAVSAWQIIGKDASANDIIACVDSWQMKEPTVYDDAVKLCHLLKDHKNVVFLHGDASGESRSAQTTTSMWKMVRDVFQEHFDDVRNVVPRKNPSVKDTIQCANWALQNNLVRFNRDERNVYMSLQAVRADKYGEIDKSIDYKNTTATRTHEADTARYAFWHYFQKVYPGRRGGYFIV